MRIKSGITVFEIFIIMILLIVLFPVLPFNILFIIWAVHKNIEEKYFLYLGLTTLAIMSIIVYNTLEVFISESGLIASLMIQNIIKTHKIPLHVYKNYSFMSWFTLFVISVIFSCLAVKSIKKRNKLTELGVNSLDYNIENMGVKRNEH